MEAYKDDILDMRRHGISKQNISLALRVGVKRIVLALEEWGDPFPLPASQRVEAARDEIIAARRRGETREKIAQRYGCGTDTIQRKLREWGETNQRGGRYDKAEMQRLRNAGLTGEDIAALLGCAVATVYAYTQPSAGEPKNDSEHKTVNKYTPGKRYGDYVFLETVEARRPLWLFEHRTGWKESFTELQLREARIA